MADVLVGIFDRYEDAERVRSELVGQGFDPGRIAMSDTGWHVSHAGTAVPASAPDSPTTGSTTGTLTGGGWTGSGSTATGGTGTTGDATTGTSHLSLGQRISAFFHRIFGSDEAPDDAHPYYEAVRRGSIAVTVDVADATERATAEGVMARCGAVDIDARSATWRSHGWQGWDPEAPALSEAELRLERERHTRPPGEAAGTTATGSALADAEIAGEPAAPGDRVTVPVVEESLQVGKREVSRGGLRVFTRVESVPVEEQVTLHEEQPVLERRNVDRPATEADLAAARDATIEVRATGEEAVVGKTARVVEEVTVGKKSTERTEHVSDTVRRTRVDVKEEAPAARGTRDGSGRTDGKTGRVGTDDPEAVPGTPGTPSRRPRGGGDRR